jgi:FMN-dependent NADH-azoreductase
MRALAHDETYLRTVLSFIGITDIQSIVSKAWR